MNFVGLAVITSCIVQPFYVQAELSIVTHDIEISHINSTYLKDVEVYVLDNGHDNEVFANFTLVRTLPSSGTVNLKLLGASMGEFVVPTGIDFTSPLCASNEPIFANYIHEQMGISPCMTSPGVYGNSRVVLVKSNTLPLTFPPNRYKMEVIFKDEGYWIVQMDTYFDIQ